MLCYEMHNHFLFRICVCLSVGLAGMWIHDEEDRERERRCVPPLPFLHHS